MDKAVTAENFEQQQKEFLGKNRDLWLMIRPDRPFDVAKHRYEDEDARRKGNTAMKAWFEYLAAKGFIRTFNAWRAILKSGHSIMVVCEDPLVFDFQFVPPAKAVLAADFWGKFEQSRTLVDHRYDEPEAREYIIQGFKNLRKELQSGRGQPRVKGWATLGEAVAKPSALVDAKLSAELIGKLG